MMMSLPSGMNGFSASQGYGFGVPRKAVAMPAKPTEQAEDKEAVALQQAATQHRTNATLAGLATVVAVPTVGLGVSEFAYRNGLEPKLKYAGPTAESLVDNAKIEADVRAELAPKLTALQEQELASQRTPILTEAQNIAGNLHAQTIEGAIEFHQKLTPESTEYYHFTPTGTKYTGRLSDSILDDREQSIGVKETQLIQQLDQQKIAEQRFNQVLDETVTQYIADKLPSEYAANPADHYRHEKIKQFLASLDDDKSQLFGIKAEHKDAIKQQLSHHSNAQTNYAVDNVQQVNRLIEGYSGLNGNPRIPTIPVDYDLNIKQYHLSMLNGGYDSYNMGMDLRKTPVFAEADDVLSNHRSTVVNLELEIQNDRRQYAQMVEHNKAVDVHEQKMVKLKQLHQEFDSVKSVTTEHPELQTEIAKKTTASIAEIDAKIAKTTKTVGEKGLGKAWTNNADELTKAGFKDLAEHTKGARTWAIGAGAAMAVLGTGLTLWQLSESGKAEQASKERQTKLAELRKMDVQA